MELLLFTIGVATFGILGLVISIARLSSRFPTDHHELGPWRRADAPRPTELKEPETLTRIRLGLGSAVTSQRVWDSLLERMDTVAMSLGENPDWVPPAVSPPPRRWWQWRDPVIEARDDGQPTRFHQEYLDKRILRLEELAGLAHQPSPTNSRNHHKGH